MENKTQFSNPPFRVGKNVILRIPQESDVETLCGYINDPQVNQYLGRNLPMSIEQERQWITERQVQGPDKYTFVLIHKDSRDVIGTIGIHDINFIHGTATTGTAIGNTKYQGQGLGTEAKMLLLDFAFNVLNLRLIQSKVLSFNPRSVAYAKKCGYKEVARLPKRFYRNGEYHDEIILDCYAEEWRELWEKGRDNFLAEKTE